MKGILLETSALLVLAPVASTTAVFISITSDAASKWNKNVITMPVSRSQIIGEKFLFYILLAFLLHFSCSSDFLVFIMKGGCQGHLWMNVSVRTLPALN